MPKSKYSKREAALKLMALLVQFARYDNEPKEPIKTLMVQVGHLEFRYHCGTIGMIAWQLFNEYCIAQTIFEKTAALATLHKCTGFWHLKPQPKPNQQTITQSDLEKVVAEEFGKAA